jgi:penicillin-binding protein 1A
MKQTSANRPRRSPSRNKNTFVTKSGKTIKINRSLSDRLREGREAKARRKAAYLSSLPANPWKRFLFRISPKRIIKYWFSREGAIMALKIAGVSFVIGFLLLVGVFAYFRKDLPKINDVSGNNFGGSITYYDRTGQVLLYQDYNAKKRVPVKDDQIAEVMKQATLAIEDRNFFKHGAFDTKGIMRAALNEVKGGSGGRQGGSTITQQLVKLSEGWENERTVSRKIKELILAVELEREYDKKDILTGYLNMAPYGNVNYGVETAAQDYFGVSAKDLSLAQAAMLAAIPKAPGSLSPFSSPEFNKSLGTNYFDREWLIGRQHYILDVMVDEKYISKAKAEEAKKVDILAQVKPRQDKYANIKAPYFVKAAKAELYVKFPKAVVDNGGWKVITTLDMSMQEKAETAIANNASRFRGGRVDNAAFVAEDTATGQIVALVGGRDFSTQSLSFATEAQISPGSSIKPYTYATFINNNTSVGAGSVLYDQQGALPGYVCTNKARPESGGNCLFNFTRSYYGPVTLRYALGGSLNVPAVKAFTSVVPNDTSDGHTNSINKVISTMNGLMGKDGAYKCYVEGTVLSEATKADEVQCRAAAGIGDGAYLTLADHVNGVASLARLGKAIPQTALLEVKNASGKTLLKYKDATPKQVIQPDAAYIVNDMASDPGASYLGGVMKFHRYKGWKTGIKTGTTNGRTDGLLMAWNKKYSAGIWIGNYNRAEFAISPENITNPIMREFMQGAIDSLGAVQPDNWAAPAGIKTLPAFQSRVPFSTQSRPPATDLFPSWYVSKSGGASQVLDKVSGKIATSCTPELARQNLGAAAANLNVDIYAGGRTGNGAAANTGNDDVHNCNDSKPIASITAINGVATGSQTEISCPATGCVLMVHVEQGTHALSSSARPNFPGTLTLLVNGEVVQTQPAGSSGDYQFTYSPASDSSGSIQLTVQITDSVLYQGSEATTITIAAQTNSGGPGNSGGNGNNP